MEHKNIPFIIEEKNFKENGYFEGYGSTFGGEPDSYGDVIIEGAFTKSLEQGGRNNNGVAMLYQHNPSRPIGVWEEISENKQGLFVRGKLVLSSTDGKDTYELMKAGALQGLSIGYDIVRFKESKNKKVRYLEEVNLWEISPVTFPANREATITNVKNMIEKAKTERELESALRESGLSKSSSQYILKLCKPSLLRESEIKKESSRVDFNSVLDKLVFENTLLKDFVKKDFEGEKRVIPYRSYPTLPKATSWDVHIETKKAKIEDLKKMCAWFDNENPDIRSSYKFLHHKSDGYSVVWKGVSVAMASLLGARGKIDIPENDRKGVYNHLAKHYQEFGKKIPEFRNYSHDELIEVFPKEIGWTILLNDMKKIKMEENGYVR